MIRAAINWDQLLRQILRTNLSMLMSRILNRTMSGRDPADPDSDSGAEEQDATQPTVQCTGKKPKSGDIVARVLALEGKTRTQALDSSFKKNGSQKKYSKSDFLQWSTDDSDDESDGEDVEHEADWVEVQKPGTVCMDYWRRL